jgi:uncharacterized protein (DUF362 family)
MTMYPKGVTRREFLRRIEMAMAVAALSPLPTLPSTRADDEKAIVSIVKRQNRDTEAAVEAAIDLLGGIESVTADKDRIMLKPNLVSNARSDTTDPRVVRKLAEMMIEVGKEVSIGEGSAAAGGYNADNDRVYRTWNPDILDPMQQFVFDQLNYTEMAEELGIPLINLHTGEMVEVEVPDAFVFDTLSLHHSLTEIDLLCSVPLMKTHVLATVTLGLKNVIGLYAGSVYGSVRGYVHTLAADVADVGIALEIVDMARANKMGLTVIDGLQAMEGDGPSLGPDSQLVNMDLIIAGTNPLAADMVAASVMGFDLDEIPTFEWAVRAGMTPTSLEKIEVVGETIESVRREFRKPSVLTWKSIADVWGNEVME